MTRRRVLSLFSGVGGMDLGLEAAGHTIVAQCELGHTTDANGKRTNTYAREILRRHWPDVPLHDDVTTLNPEEFRGRVDLVAGGSPCQDLSVAGRRGGLDGARSGLFWHQCRIADQAAAPWVLWENVAGAFSSNNGADFAAVLWGLTGALPDVPDGGWRTCGVVVGPKRTAVWRLLDARWFGVAQRRRRVFVVAGPRGECGPEVLLEPDGLRGDLVPGGEAGQVIAALTANGVGAGGVPDDNAAQAGHLIPFRMQAFGQYANDDTASVLKARDYKDATDLVMSFHPTQDQGVNAVDICHSLGTTNPPAGVAVPIDMLNALRESTAGETTGVGIGEDGDPMFTPTGHTMGRPAVATDLEVRRLTPLECERLMGWPDDHTRWGVTESGEVVEVADSHRYRACGNGVVAPVTEWIGRRLAVAA